MLNRRHIRVKVMQLLFSLKGRESDDLKADEKLLFYSIDNMYMLYLSMLSLFIEFRKKAINHNIKTKNKQLATSEDKNPNTKFINNELLVFLSKNKELKEVLEKHVITIWQDHDGYVDLLFRKMLTSDLYKDYMKTRVSSFKEDKDFIIAFYKTIIAPNDKLYDFLEDSKLTWLDDFPEINTIILKLFRKAKPNISNSHFIPNLYKDETDKEFVKDLFTKTILNKVKFTEEITAKTTNWDSDRIANIDLVLLQMAICEFQKFPSIPIKVTINEYLEIAKEYSTPKSSVFINGILDKIVKEYQATGTLNKIGRGLM
jgi:N utilization substance protein B